MYISNWQDYLPKPNEIKDVSFKLYLTGGYALRVCGKDGFLQPIFNGKCSTMIPNNEVKKCLEWLYENEYIINEHSVIDYREIL